MDREMLDECKRGVGPLVGAAWIVLLTLLVLAVSEGSGSAQEAEAAAETSEVAPASAGR